MYSIGHNTNRFALRVPNDSPQQLLPTCRFLMRNASQNVKLLGIVRFSVNFGRRQILIILKYHEISGESWSGGRKFISGTLPSMNLRLCFHFVPTIAAGTFKPAQKKASTIDVTFLAMSYMIKGFQLNRQLFKARSFHFTCNFCQAAGGLQQA